MKSIDKIIDVGAAFWDRTRPLLVSRRRDALTSAARFSIMGALRVEGYGANTIAAAFNRDHSTVCNAIRHLNPATMGHYWPRHQKFSDLVKTSPDLFEDPLEDVINATEMALSKIDQNIVHLRASRRLLETQLAALRARAIKSP